MKDSEERWRCDRGFTIIEIVIAVAILATALVTLLGVQASILERTVRDRNVQQAMLLAREALAAIESLDEPLDLQSEQMPIGQLLEKLGIEHGAWDAELEQLDLYTAQFNVTAWGIPGLDDEAMKRVSLVLFWGPDPRDQFEVVYFIPQDEGDEDAYDDSGDDLDDDDELEEGNA